MSAKPKKTPAPPTPAVAPPVATSVGAAAPAANAPFDQRHPKIANALFAGLWVYVALLALLALDQTFHWGIFGPKLPPTP